jgi:putative DNA primase/helicase
MMHSIRDATEQFSAEIRRAGLVSPETIEADGKLHRFASNGKHGDEAGWYVLHGDGIAAGAFGDWRSGISKTWHAERAQPLTEAERETLHEQIEQAKRKAEAERAQAAANAAKRARQIWNSAKPADDSHAYLMRKVIKAHGSRIYRGPLALCHMPLNGCLIVPARGTDGQIYTLEFIHPDSRDGDNKRFQFGGDYTGRYFAIGTTKGAAALCIAEGFATGATIHEATGYPVAVAFNAGNLEPVARALRAKLPALRLILCADDDAATEGNTGLTKATAAAQSVGGLVAVPDFGTDRPEGATDMNDLAKKCGAEAVERAIANASAPTRGEVQPEAGNAPAGEYARTVELIRGSDVKPEAVSWLWGGWLAVGKVHILGGAPGTGKTTISMALAATVTTAGRWPDGNLSPIGNVAIWSGEDDPADTLVPRLVLSGADLSRVYFIADVRERNERRSFDPARDMEVLQRKLVEIGDVRLLIVDPIVSAIAGDSHKNAEVRRGLQPLADLAASMRCALLGITHFSKGTGGRDPVERLTGSLAFGALARVVLVAAKHQEEGEDGRTVRLFLRAKSNIGPDDGGFEYDLHQGELKTHPGIFASSVLWGDTVEGAARELLATADATGEDGEGGTLADAKRFLSDLLADGPLPTKTIKADADGAGYSWATIRRAKKVLGIETRKEGGSFGGGKQQWVWALPATEHAHSEHLQDESLKMLRNAEDAQQKEVSTFRNLEHLQGNSGAVEVEI